MAKGHHIDHRHRSESLHQLRKARRRQKVPRTPAKIPSQAIDEGADDPLVSNLNPITAVSKEAIGWPASR